MPFVATMALLTIAGAAARGISEYTRLLQEADLLERNAALRQQQALSALAAGEIGASDRLREAGRQASRAAVFLGQSGAFGGTAERIRESVRRVGDIDAERIRLNASMEAWGYREVAFDMLEQAEHMREAAPAALGLTLLGGLLDAGQVVARG